MGTARIGICERIRKCLPDAHDGADNKKDIKMKMSFSLLRVWMDARNESIFLTKVKAWPFNLLQLPYSYCIENLLVNDSDAIKCDFLPVFLLQKMQQN